MKENKNKRWFRIILIQRFFAKIVIQYSMNKAHYNVIDNVCIVTKQVLKTVLIQYLNLLNINDNQRRIFKNKTIVWLMWISLAGPNVAYKKFALQSSNKYENSTADKAVDGNTNVSDSGTCARTSFDSYAWWKVNLGKPYLVTGIKIHNSEWGDGRFCVPFCLCCI